MDSQGLFMQPVKLVAQSKVLTYKQPLSLNMIRLFSKMLRLPTDALTKEYKLRP